MQSLELERQRTRHYRLDGTGSPVRTPAAAARYINRYGFCWLFAPRDRTLELPSLFEAVKHKRDAHIEDWDADSDRLWGWKSDLPAARRAFYGKALAGKPVFISLPMLPYAIAALGVEDAAEAYARGALPHDAKRVYDVLAQRGAMPTRALKSGAGFSDGRGSARGEGNLRFHRALDFLQARFLAAPIGAADEGLAWQSQIFDLVANWYPDASRAAARIELGEARRALIERYVSTVLVASPRALGRLWAIPRGELEPLLTDLARAKRARVENDLVRAYKHRPR